MKDVITNMASTSLSFYFDVTEPVTKQKPNLYGHYYEAVVQVEWDCSDTDMNDSIENDMNTTNLSKDLSWIHTIKYIVSSKLKLDKRTPLYISFYKVMDGILNCYVTIYPDDSAVYHVIVDENNKIGFPKISDKKL